MSFSDWLKKYHYDEASLQGPEWAQQLGHLRQAWQLEVGGDGIPYATAVGDDNPDAFRAELNRYLDRNEGNPQAQARIEAAATKLNSEGANLQAFKYGLMRADRTVDIRTSFTQRDPGTEADVLAASVAMSCGASERFIGTQFSQRAMNEAVSNRYRGASIQSLLRMQIQRAGGRAPMGRFTDSSIRQGFEADRRINLGEAYAASGLSTISVAGILGNAANKLMLQSWLDTPTTWRRWCKKSDLNDFKDHARYRLIGTGEFREVPHGGELKHVSLIEENYSISADTFGAILGLDRRDIINDDMSALSRAPAALGRMSAVKIEKTAFTKLLENPTVDDDVALFATSHASGANFEDGAADSTLTLANMSNAWNVWQAMVDGNLDPTLLSPGILLVPSGLEIAARTIINSTRLIDGAATAAQGDGNPWLDKLEIVASPFLQNSGLTGYSALAWYLMVMAGDFSPIEVGFLFGRDMPTIEQSELDFDRLGIQMRAYLDFGVAAGEWRGALKMKGEA